MATAKLGLRTSKNKDNLHSIILIISQKGRQTAIPTRYAVQKKHFKNEKITKGCSDISNIREANLKLSRKLSEAWDYIEELEEKRIIERMTAVDIANYIRNGGDKKDDNFIKYYEYFLNGIENKSTHTAYLNTLKYIKRNYSNLYFADVTKAWLYKFKNKRLQECKPATVNIDLRNIRAVFNHAIDVTETVSQNTYPFRKFEFVKTTPRNLRLSLDKIKQIRDFKAKDKDVEMIRDFFMLSFYLIGANTSDIYNLNEIKDGRIEYFRNKTNKFYSIRIEPEAMDLFNKYRGKNKPLLFSEKFNFCNTLTNTANKKLKIIGKEIGIPNLIMYHARHTWAGLAAQHPISAGKDLIAQALGHGRQTVTDTYFDYDTRLVDDLNRKVLDLLK